MYTVVPLESEHGLPTEITRWHPGKKEEPGRSGLSYQLVEITERQGQRYGYYICKAWISEGTDILSISGAMLPKPPATAHVIARASMNLAPPPDDGALQPHFIPSDWSIFTVRDVNSGRTTASQEDDDAYFVNVDFIRSVPYSDDVAR